MTFSAVIPSGGLLGWSFLKRTQDAQKEVLAQSSQYSREAAYFRENISKVQTAEDLVSDRTLLRLSLAAFGLEDDIDNRFFIQKVLADGTTSEDALSNRLADRRYPEFSAAFGFEPTAALQTIRPGFADTILDRALNNSFEIAVGDQDTDLRLALSLDSQLTEIAEGSSSDTAKWFTILGTPPLRTVFEGALNLPSSIGTMDIDQQLEVFRDRAQSIFGTDQVEDFAAEEMRDDLARKFLLQQQVGQFSVASSAANALTLLQG